MHLIRKILLLALALFAAAVALSEEGAAPFDVLIVADPAQLSAPGDITLAFTLTNTAEEDVTEVRLLDSSGEELYRVDAIPSGSAADFTLQHAVSREELDLELIPFQVMYTHMGQDLSVTAQARISHRLEGVNVQFLRHVLSDVTDLDGDITIVYEIINTSDADLDGLSITDPLGGYTAAIDHLAAGERTAAVNRAHLEEDAVSSPRLAVASSDVYGARQLDDLPIHVAHGQLQFTFTAGHSLYAPDTAEVILRLTNPGNQSYRNITVYDDINGGIIADSLELPPEHAPVEVTHSYPIRGAATYRWRITATTTSGDVINLVTDPVDVPTGSRSGLPQLSLSIETDMPHISRGGSIPLTLTIMNQGSGLARQVVISEETDGECLALTVVPTGDPTVRHIEYAVNESRDLSFTVTYLDPDGRLHAAEAEPLAIEVGAGGQDPLGVERGPTFIGTATDITNPQMMTFVIIATVVLVLVLSIVWLVSARRAHFKRRVQAEARRQLTTGDAARKRPSARPSRKRPAKPSGKQG